MNENENDVPIKIKNLKSRGKKKTKFIQTSKGKFIEDLSSQVDKVFNVGDIFAFTATPSAGFSNSGEDVEVTVTFQHVK